MGMRPLIGLAALLLAGCVSAPLLPSADEATAGAASLSEVGSTVYGRAKAPFTAAESGTPGASFATTGTGSGRGRASTVIQGSLSVDLGQGKTRLSGRWIRPEALSGVAQRYSNDCAQAALATALGFLGVGSATYEELIETIPPTNLGTRLEDVLGYLQGLDEVAVTPMRQADMAVLRDLVAEGKPVPVVLTLVAPSMHYSLVMGTGTTSRGDRYVLLKDPSQEDPETFLVLSESEFLGAWENSAVRMPVIGWLAGFVSHTNADNYQRVALDLGLAR